MGNHDIVIHLATNIFALIWIPREVWNWEDAFSLWRMNFKKTGQTVFVSELGAIGRKDDETWVPFHFI
jgi:hypothetical protein